MTCCGRGRRIATATAADRLKSVVATSSPDHVLHAVARSRSSQLRRHHAAFEHVIDMPLIVTAFKVAIWAREDHRLVAPRPATIRRDHSGYACR